jgi:hypothetical protein
MRDVGGNLRGWNTLSRDRPPKLQGVVHRLHVVGADPPGDDESSGLLDEDELGKRVSVQERFKMWLHLVP